MSDQPSFTSGPWEFSSDGIWATSPWNARVKIATVTFFAAMNGIDAKANGRLLAAAPTLVKALAPIAKAADNYADCADDRYVDDDAQITVADLREARAVLATLTDMAKDAT